MAQIPPAAASVLKHLRKAGYEAWFVGGCVRDTLLGLEPSDWDIATSATPEEVMTVFPRRIIPFGLQHGTVLVRSGAEGGVEVTTFRMDGEYEDHRRPSSVVFTTSLEEDLLRRDFTINAMAMGLEGEIRDPFGGQEDLKRRILRCVGNPDARFTEDALRLMRGLRFAAGLGLTVEPATAAVMHRNRDLLSAIAMERIEAELRKLLCGESAPAVLREFPDVPGVFWPELLDMVGFDQHNIHHCYDVWEHTLHTLEAVDRQDVALRFAALLHDVGKPHTFTLDERGEGHFHGHAEEGARMADEMLRRIRHPKALRRREVLLVARHGDSIPLTEKAARRALRKLGTTDLRCLIALKRADNLAQAKEYRYRQEELDRAEALIDDVLRQTPCFTLRDLALNGHDMINLGLNGKEIGELLKHLLDRVARGELPNDRAALLRAARRKVSRKRYKQRKKEIAFAEARARTAAALEKKAETAARQMTE